MGNTVTRSTVAAAEHDKLRKAAEAETPKTTQPNLPLPRQKKQKNTSGANLPLPGDRRRKKKKGTAGQSPVKGNRAA